MNPALAGRMLLASFPTLMTSWVDPTLRLSIQKVDGISAATPMSYLHSGVLPPQKFEQLLLGHHSGSLGESCAFMLLLGGLYLMGRRLISSRIPLAYLGTVALLTFLFPAGGCGRLDWMVAQLFSGGLILGALFMATDPTTTPVTPRGHVMFGVGCGVLTVVLRYFGSYHEGVGWAILTMNCCAWLLDKVGLPRRYGDKPYAEIQEWFDGVVDSLSQIKIVRPDLSALTTRDGEAPGEGLIPVLREHGRNFLWLLGVVLCTGAMVFGVQHATELAVVQADTQAQQEQLDEVMPGAAFSSESPYWANGALSIHYAYNEKNEHMGYCVEVQTQGFGGMMTMIVGVDVDGKVTGLAITDHKETFSVVEKALSWQNLRKYEGLSGTIRYSGSNSVDVVSGATATSRAITDGVNQALAIVAGLNEDQQLEFEESELE
jgi:Na+-translocating ferredoxin:NAD+ oxidoreductase RnfG subunit